MEDHLLNGEVCAGQLFSGIRLHQHYVQSEF